MKRWRPFKAGEAFHRDQERRHFAVRSSDYLQVGDFCSFERHPAPERSIDEPCINQINDARHVDSCELDHNDGCRSDEN